MENREDIEKKVFDLVKNGDQKENKDLAQEIKGLSYSELEKLFPEYAEYAETAVDFEVVKDNNPEDPRNWDHLGTMYCIHSRYKLGDENAGEKAFELLKSIPDMSESDRVMLDNAIEQNMEYLSDRKTVYQLLDNYGEHAVVLPLYLYDHGGITMNTGGFSDPWDSGQVGFIFVSKEKIKKRGDA